MPFQNIDLIAALAARDPEGTPVVPFQNIDLIRDSLNCKLTQGRVVFWQDAERGGDAEEASHAFETFFVQHIVDVGGEVGVEGLFGDGEPL